VVWIDGEFFIKHLIEKIIGDTETLVSHLIEHGMFCTARINDDGSGVRGRVFACIVFEVDHSVLHRTFINMVDCHFPFLVEQGSVFDKWHSKAPPLALVSHTKMRSLAMSRSRPMVLLDCADSRARIAMN